MPILPILTYPDPFLKKATMLIEKVDDELVALAQDMLTTMYQAPGVGLAAPQVGQGLSLIVIDTDRNLEEPKPVILFNPEIVASEGEIIYEEGCLSVPDYTVEIKRASWIKVRALDLNEKPIEFEAENYRAVVFQHEIDHLNGTLIIDRVSPLKRELYRRKLQKAHKENET